MSREKYLITTCKIRLEFAYFLDDNPTEDVYADSLEGPIVCPVLRTV